MDVFKYRKIILHGGDTVRLNMTGPGGGWYLEGWTQIIIKVSPGLKYYKKKKAQFTPPRCIHFEFSEDTLLGMIQDAMAPQAAKLRGFEDYYTKNILAIVDVALATTVKLNIKIKNWQKSRKHALLSVYCKKYIWNIK